MPKAKPTSTRIWVTFRKAGIHKYPGAPEDVAYLELAHRHLFKFKVTVEVLHNNRDIEFHQFLNWIEAQYGIGGTLHLTYKSCEMIAEELLVMLTEKYGTDRRFEIEVSEDGECGAILSQFTT